MSKNLIIYLDKKFAKYHKTNDIYFSNVNDLLTLIEKK